MEIKDFLEKQHERCRRCNEVAEWYANNHATALSEYARYAHRVVFDFIGVVQRSCKTMDDVTKLLELEVFHAWSDYKHFQREHCERFAELAMVKYEVLNTIQFETTAEQPICEVCRNVVNKTIKDTEQ